jgi:hypothetical protein
MWQPDRVPRASSALARLALPAAAVLLAVAGLAGMLARGGGRHPGTAAAPATLRLGSTRFTDPFAWTPGGEARLVARAARGTAHGIYVLSPGGVEASAARTARWRGDVVAAARTAGIAPDTLEGLVLLESAGRTDAVTAAGLQGAVGLTQILAQTGSGLLGMHVDTAASHRLTARLQRAVDAGDTRRAADLIRRRAQADQRFDGRASLAATGRYLAQARARFGRGDLAIAAYHMGMGNLEAVLRDYAGHPSGSIADIVRTRHLSYARVYFDSTPTRHAAAWRRLASFGDDSSNYLWKVLAARSIMHAWRTDRAGLRRLATLHSESVSGELALHPLPGTPRFADAAALAAAYRDRTLLALPGRPAATGLRVDPRMGAGARDPALYRGLRPQALGVALYLGAQVRALTGGGTLTLRASVRDAAAAAPVGEQPAPSALHATGWAFDVERRYDPPAQAQALQFALDRLSVLGAIAWERQGRVIHVTAGPEGELLPLVARLEGSHP